MVVGVDGFDRFESAKDGGGVCDERDGCDVGWCESVICPRAGIVVVLGSLPIAWVSGRHAYASREKVWVAILQAVFFALVLCVIYEFSGSVGGRYGVWWMQAVIGGSVGACVGFVSGSAFGAMWRGQ
jgi:hypothetical protein